jgi:Flp pilus assembly protein TadB
MTSTDDTSRDHEGSAENTGAEPYDQRRAARRSGERTVPGVAGAPDSSADGQQGLLLHAGIAVIATALSVLVTVVFIMLGSWPLAVVFAVVAVASAGALGWALQRRRRGQELRRLRADEPQR